MATDQEIIEGRNCYCKPGEQYCGECDCGKPGHVCHYPGPVAFTGCWCDECYVAEWRKSEATNWEDEES